MNRDPNATPDFSSFEIRSRDSRRAFDKAFVVVCLVTAVVSIVTLTVLLATIFMQGYGRLAAVNAGDPPPATLREAAANAIDGTLEFLQQPPSPEPEEAGIMPAFWGTLWVSVLCAAFTLPIGVATAILLEEFKPQTKLFQRVHGFIQLNISNLAGVPSVVYGIIGLTTFVSFFGLIGTAKKPALEIGVQYFDQFLTVGDAVALIKVAPNDETTKPVDGMEAVVRGEVVQLRVLAPGERLPKDKAERRLLLRPTAKCGRISKKEWYYLRFPFGRGVLAGALTLMLVVLPIVIVSTQESLRAVPDSLRDGALGMGATRWQVVRNVTLPAAIPGVMTGSILAMSRAIGEAAPFLIIAGIVFIATPPGHLMDDFTVMPLQIYNWAQRPQPQFHEVAASGIIILLAILLTFNAIAIVIRQLTQKPLS